MKILYFHQYFSTSRGAYSTRAYEFARRWVQQGHEVTMVTSVYSESDLRVSGLTAQLSLEGIDLKVLNIRLANRHGFVRRTLTFLAYMTFACWHALIRQADVVLCSSGPITIGLPGLLARWVRGRPFVFEVRDLWPEGAIQLGILKSRILIQLARWLEGACYRWADAVVALSPGQAEDIASRFALPRLEVVTNASDNELAARVDRPDPTPAWVDDQFILLYAGALGLINDGAQLVDLAAELERRGRTDFVIVVIGEGRERTSIEHRARELGLECLHFLGPRPHTEVFEWLNAADVSLFTVKDAAFLDTASPNKMFDSFAAGVPMVQNTQGWIKDLFDDEQCGLTVHNGDSAGFADAIEALMDDPELRENMAHNARRLASTRFDRELVAEKMLSVLTRAAER